MEETKKDGNILALLPIGVFLVIFLGSGFITGDFYNMPAVVGFLIALIIAFCQNRKVSFQQKIHIIAEGVGNENIVVMCLIFLAAGAFSGAVSAAGGVESTVNLGLSFLPSKIAVVGLMIIGCFISVSMGTSMGTIAALAPIASGISEKTGISPAICIGAVVCGAMFGDNLSMISDTTIAAVRTQGCEMKDKFKANFFIVFPAAIVTLVLFYYFTKHGVYQGKTDFSYNFLQVVPYLLVLFGALAGVNVFLVLIGGTIVSLIVGIISKTIVPIEIFQVLGKGITSMYDITIISILVVCVVSLVREYGGIQYILGFIKKRVKRRKGGEFGIAGLSVLIDLCTANNTIAIIIAGPIAKEISDEFAIPAKRSASILDIFTSACQGMIPYGAQLLSAATLMELTPFEIMPYLFYPILMMISALCFILFSGQSKNTLDRST